MMKRTRVKCANCGMIYDITEAETGELHWGTCCCPKCDSNAYDALKDLTEYYKKG